MARRKSPYEADRSARKARHKVRKEVKKLRKGNKSFEELEEMHKEWVRTGVRPREVNPRNTPDHLRNFIDNHRNSILAAQEEYMKKYTEAKDIHEREYYRQLLEQQNLGPSQSATQQVTYGLDHAPRTQVEQAQRARNARAEEIEAMTRAGMTSRQIQEVLMGEREKKESGSSKEEKNKYKAFGENTGHAMTGMMNIFNPAMFGNILMIIVIVLMMWVVIQFFGMV